MSNSGPLRSALYRVRNCFPALYRRCKRWRVMRCILSHMYEMFDNQDSCVPIKPRLRKVFLSARLLFVRSLFASQPVFHLCLAARLHMSRAFENEHGVLKLWVGRATALYRSCLRRNPGSKMGCGWSDGRVP